MQNEDLLTATSKLAFLVWVKDLLSGGGAKLSLINESIVELSAQASSYFSLGRRKLNNTPVISCDYSITPYVFSVPIKQVVMVGDDALYLVYGANAPAFALKLKISSKRQLMLNLEQILNRGQGSTIDFYSHYTDEKNKEVHFSRILHQSELIRVKEITEIFPNTKSTTTDYNDMLDEQSKGRFDIYDPDNFDNFKGEGYVEDDE